MEFDEEYRMCMSDPYYFYINYFTIDGKRVKDVVSISEDDFYRYLYTDLIAKMKKMVLKGLPTNK